MKQFLRNKLKKIHISKWFNALILGSYLKDILQPERAQIDRQIEIINTFQLCSKVLKIDNKNAKC